MSSRHLLNFDDDLEVEPYNETTIQKSDKMEQERYTTPTSLMKGLQISPTGSMSSLQSNEGKHNPPPTSKTFDHVTQQKGKEAAEDDPYDTVELGEKSAFVEQEEEEDKDEWDFVSTHEMDENTMEMKNIPSVVFQESSFKAMMKEYIDHYSLSEEKKKNLGDAYTVVKFASGIAYNALTETAFDIADKLTQKHFDCDVDELPTELRTRLLNYLPENTRNAISRTSEAFKQRGFVLPPNEQRQADAEEDG